MPIENCRVKRSHYGFHKEVVRFLGADHQVCSKVSSVT